MQQFEPLRNWRAQYLAVFAIISVFLAVGSTALVWWMATSSRFFPPPPPPPNTNYTNYDVRILRYNQANPDEPTQVPYISQASVNAVTAYIQQYPQPQNVKILKGLSTAQIYGYMQNYFSGGLKVDCSYCHNLANFGDYSNVNKNKAYAMLVMTQDLNQNWVSKLPQAAGNKAIICATCHNGKPKNFSGSNTVLSNYPSDQSPLPDDYVLPLANLDSLIVTGKADPDLNVVQSNQYAMNHMNYSLGVGCAFCHNANYFPSNEKPQKGWALTMLQMSQHIKNNYNEIMANKAPSCWMCHQQQQVPPGSAPPDKIPPQITTKPQGTT